jgi:F-type H+-transporting ATPase subunit delta
VAVAAALLDPRSDRAARKKAAEKLTSGASSQLVKDFAGFLVDRGRTEVLPVAAEEFATMLREHRREAVAEVVSASKLDDEARAALRAKLETITSRKVTLVEKVDPELLGGMRVKVGSMLLDGSVRRRLASMRADLMRVPLPHEAVKA